MLLVEKFEIAQDKILEGIETSNISLILEGSEAFDKAVKDFLAIVEQMGLIYAGDVGLGKEMGKILQGLADEAKKIQQANDEEDEDVDFGANWKNLLKAKSPWNSGESHMTTLNAHAAKLDILTIGMKQIIVKIGEMCEKYKEIFAINDQGIAIKDKTVNKELTLAAIAGKKGEELINAFKIGEAPEDTEETDTEESTEETNDTDPQVQVSHYSRDGAVLAELLGFGGGGGKSDLELVYKNFKPLLDQIPGNKRQQAKKLYAYFQELADASKDLKKVFTNILTQQEPSSKFQDVVKNTRGKWMRKIFSDQGSDYKLTKDEVETIVKAVFETPFSKLGTMVKNLIKVESGGKLEAVVEDVGDVTAQEENQIQEEVNEDPDAKKKIEAAKRIVQELAEKDIEVTVEQVIDIKAQVEKDNNADVGKIIKEVLKDKIPSDESDAEKFIDDVAQVFNFKGTSDSSLIGPQDDEITSELKELASSYVDAVQEELDNEITATEGDLVEILSDFRKGDKKDEGAMWNIIRGKFAGHFDPTKNSKKDLTALMMSMHEEKPYSKSGSTESDTSSKREFKITKQDIEQKINNLKFESVYEFDSIDQLLEAWLTDEDDEIVSEAGKRSQGRSRGRGRGKSKKSRRQRSRNTNSRTPTRTSNPRRKGNSKTNSQETTSTKQSNNSTSSLSAKDKKKIKDYKSKLQARAIKLINDPKIEPTENGLIPKEEITDQGPTINGKKYRYEDSAQKAGIAESFNIERWLKLAGILND